MRIRMPHTLETRYHAVKLLVNGYNIDYVARKYHVSVRSLYRWKGRYDGSKASLESRYCAPHRSPNAHTPEEEKHIRDYLKRNPDSSRLEIWYKLKVNCGYKRHPSTFYKWCLKHVGYHSSKKRKAKRIVQDYDTPIFAGVKWQMDVKYVPNTCKSVRMHGDERYYQYTIIDEASRKRFIFPYKEKSSYSTCDFVKRAIKFFGYIPLEIQTDNGTEFTHIKESNIIHPLDVLMDTLHIHHKLIRPCTPRHNGKVERSHRKDSECFYRHLKFYSYDDLILQMKRWNYRYNNTPMRTLDYKTPCEKEKEAEWLKSLASIFDDFSCKENVLMISYS